MRKIKTKIYLPTALTGNMDKHYIPVLEDLRKAIYSDRMLSRLADSDNIVIHSSVGYPVAKYKNTGISVGIEPLNPMIRQDLTLDISWSSETEKHHRRLMVYLTGHCQKR
ncbi:hypothetical protein MLM25_21200 [Escherichia coli]|mgnify:CR=1 FL=1|nr:hypothetical protein [Escherichia coli]MDK2541836.1 hypothetical protein [Escherichia coli]